MHPPHCSTGFFFFICHKGGDEVLESERKVLSTAPDTQPSCVSLPVPAGLLQFALLSWVEMKNDRPRKRPASKTVRSLTKLPSPRVCHLFIDDGYGGLTKNPPRLQLGDVTLRGGFFGRVRRSISSHKAQLRPLAGAVDMATIGVTAHDGLSLTGEEGDSGLCWRLQ